MPKAQGHKVGLDGAFTNPASNPQAFGSSRVFLGLSQLTLLCSLPFTCFLVFYHLQPVRQLSLNQAPATGRAPAPHPVQGRCLPPSCQRLSTLPPAGEGRREGKRNPPGASGAQPWRSPGVWFQLGGQIPGSQASAGGMGVHSAGLRMRRLLESGRRKRLPKGVGLRGLLGKKPGLAV